MRVIYDKVKGVIKIIPPRRERLTVTLSKQITVEEVYAKMRLAGV